MIYRSLVIFVSLAILNCADAEESTTVEIRQVSTDAVDFERQIAPLLSRLGCNAGSCHGASDGQGGFKLSLFGSSAAFDYAAITARDGKRIDLEKPQASLLLQKPTNAVDHEGGLRFEK